MLRSTGFLYFYFFQVLCEDFTDKEHQQRITLQMCFYLQGAGSEGAGRTLSTLGQLTEGGDNAIQRHHQLLPGDPGWNGKDHRWEWFVSRCFVFGIKHARTHSWAQRPQSAKSFQKANEMRGLSLASPQARFRRCLCTRFSPVYVNELFAALIIICPWKSVRPHWNATALLPPRLQRFTGKSTTLTKDPCGAY